jgi:hypothetical protein
MTVELPSQLLESLHSADDFAREAGEDVIRQFRRVMTRYVRSVKGLLLDVREGQGRASDLIDLAEQEEILKAVKDLLNDSGYESLVRAFERSLVDVGRKGLEYFEQFDGVDATFGGLDSELVDRMATTFLDELDFQVESKVLRPMESQIRASILSTKTRQEVVDNVTAIINNNGILRQDGKEFTQANIEVLIDDSEVRFMQFVRNEKADELGHVVYIFSGPNDTRTSDQCKLLLGEVSKERGQVILHGAPGFWYKDEIGTHLHPDLRDDPLTARGHFGCRHEWLPVTEEMAKDIDPRFEPRQ